MIVKDIKETEIIDDSEINSKFLSIHDKKLGIVCRILNSDFFIDSFNYFPITKEHYSFKEIFSWGEISKYKNFYSEQFIDNLNKKKKNLKNYTNALIIGSSTTDNYYRNMITFLPRIFFLKEKNISLALHRNSSNKFGEFISQILLQLNIEISKIIYLDDDFYYFTNSKIPQFFNNSLSIEILHKAFSKKIINRNVKLYITRQNSNYRKLINEGDLIDILKKEDFQIIDTNSMSIIEQIKLFSSAKIVVSPTSSSLTNIVFCSKGTEIIEITPKYQYEYEQNLKNRYSDICNQLDLNYNSIEADPIEIKNINKKINKFISKKVLDESNYYKDLLVKINKLNKLISIINKKS